MIKFAAVFAMLNVAIDCADKAIAPGEYAWMWWIVSTCWVLNAVTMCFAKVEVPYAD